MERTNNNNGTNNGKITGTNTGTSNGKVNDKITTNRKNGTKATSTTKPNRKIHIDDDIIPIPPVRTGPKRATRFKYPFDKLEVGQSFFVDGIQARAIAGSIANASKVLERKFVSRTMEGGARIWRVS